VITIRPGSDRFVTQIDWLDSRHSFSFGEHYDPRHMGFRSLRVINEDRVRPGAGFPTHPHRDMEILSYVLSGALEHRDGMGNRGIIRPGEVQRMTAGTGVQHSEYNPSGTEPVHFLQIWIVPGQKGLPPSYDQASIAARAPNAPLAAVASEKGGKGVVEIHQDASLHAGRLAPGERVARELREDRHAWVQVARGSVTLNGHRMAAGDGAAVNEERRLEITAGDAAEVLLFDLA
jgi:redox-sensitive bicupin YhaK (pirin superfamily)